MIAEAVQTPTTQFLRFTDPLRVIIISAALALCTTRAAEVIIAQKCLLCALHAVFSRVILNIHIFLFTLSTKVSPPN